MRKRTGRLARMMLDLVVPGSGRRGTRVAACCVQGFLALCLPVALGAQVPATPPAGVPDSIRARAADQSSRADLLLVAFDAGATPAQKDSALARISGRVVGGIPVDRPDLDGWYVVRLESRRGTRASAYGPRMQLLYLPWVRASGSWNHRADVALATTDRRSSDPVGDLLSVEVRERSVWGSLEARFAPFRSEVRRIRVDGMSPNAAKDRSRTWTLGIDPRAPSDSAWGQVAVTPDGRADVLRAPEWVGNPGVEPFHSSGLLRVEPEAFLLPFLFGPSDAPGEVKRWVHRIELGSGDSLSRGGFQVERVVSSVVGSGPGGLRSVRDSAWVTVRRSWGTYDFALADTIRMSEDLRGTVLGVARLDTLGLVSAREDTVVLRGEVHAEFPDGRIVNVPLRYEAERAVTRTNPADYLVEFWEGRGLSWSGGMAVRREPTELETRLTNGDPTATDSVLDLWRTTPDPEERRRLQSLVARTRLSSEPGTYEEFLWQEGDTALWLRGAIEDFSMPDRPPLTSRDLERMLPFLDDPERLWGIGLTGSAYSRLMVGVADAPPATTTDTSAWSLTPPAFELLGSWRERARDPRLRDLATFAWFTLAPAQRYPALAALARSPRATYLARQGLRLAEGAPVPGNPDQPGVPARDAPADLWAQWAKQGPNILGVRLPEFGLFRLAHPDRDVGDDVAYRYREASTEEERSVFRDIGRGLGVVALPSPEQIVARVAAGGPVDGAIGLLLDSAGPPPDSIQITILSRFLSHELDGAPWWDDLAGGRAGVSRAAGDGVPRFLLDSNLPDGFRPVLRDRLQIVSRRDWDAMDPRRSAVLIRVGDMRMAGPIVRFSYSITGRSDRPPRASPTSWASGSTFYLAWWEGVWWTLGMGFRWIT